mgnify:CR=1 FL=1
MGHASLALPEQQVPVGEDPLHHVALADALRLGEGSRDGYGEQARRVLLDAYSIGHSSWHI